MRNPRAFPRPIGNNGADHYEDRDVNSDQEGMTLRDYFAGQALVGILAATPNKIFHSSQADASAAYKIADAMLAERVS
jgi:hypothetical protein